MEGMDSFKLLCQSPLNQLENNKIPEKLTQCDGYAWKVFKNLSVHKTVIFLPF